MATRQAMSICDPFRRSGNYHPSIWTDERVQSLTSTSAVQREEKRETIKVLKEQTRNLILEKQQVAEQLQLIDHVQQLGLAYHFKDEFTDVLSRLHASLDKVSSQLKDDLHATALLFRLLRANGFSVSQDLFEVFRDEKGNFEARCENQIRGLLSLYEASYFEKDGEIMLKEAMDFATEQLKGFMEEGSVPEAGGLREQVAHALQIPLNWRLERVQHRWFIEACSGDDTVNPLLLEFAKLDFNLVQDMYKNGGPGSGLQRSCHFSETDYFENYLWALGFTYEPESWRCRMMETKAMCLITLIDDIYDVYGTLDELQLFTDAVYRWDLTAMDKLPEYMKLCFFALFNLVHEEGYQVMKEKGLDIVPGLKRRWGNQCKSYLEEAKWFHHGQTPKLEEYLENAWVSGSGPIILFNAYCVGKDLTRESLKIFSSYYEITRSASTLARLYNDMGTSMDELERGDVAKCIQCYMHNKGVSEEVTRREIRELMRKYWRELNGALSWDSPLEVYFKNVTVNINRTAQFFYQDRDGYVATILRSFASQEKPSVAVLQALNEELTQSLSSDPAASTSLQPSEPQAADAVATSTLIEPPTPSPADSTLPASLINLRLSHRPQDKCLLSLLL
ncbi:terpene synthase 10-like [Zingiber officinale]|uniref:terpene synthase 10-like n=1 Tax=Zingiber officinale TaxID=94328 RepID=UPI001C4ADF42|nr:terpene synthase 10-like [Zingiber officinale]